VTEYRALRILHRSTPVCRRIRFAFRATSIGLWLLRPRLAVALHSDCLTSVRGLHLLQWTVCPGFRRRNNKKPPAKGGVLYILVLDDEPTLTWGNPTLPSAMYRFTSGEFGMGNQCSNAYGRQAIRLLVVFSLHGVERGGL